MKILMFTNFYPIPYGSAGTERYVTDLSRNLVKRGHKVHIVYSPIVYKKEHAKLKLNPVEGTTLKFLPHRFNFFRLFQEVRRFNPDVIHTIYLKTGIRAEIIGSLLGKPVVCSMLLADKPAKTLFRKISTNLFNFLFKKIYFIVISKYIGESIKEDIKGAKVVLIPCWTWNYEKMKTASGKKLRNKFPKNAKIMLTVSRIVEAKGIKELIYAAKDILNIRKDCYFIVVGFGEKLEEYKNLVKKIGIDDNFKFPGPLYGDDLVEAYAGCDVIVVPSLMDCLFSLTESLVTGKPIVATDVECVTEILKDRESGMIVRRGNIDDLKNAILEVLDNKKLYKSIVRNAKKTAINYDTQTCISNIEDLYKKIMSRVY